MDTRDKYYSKRGCEHYFRILAVIIIFIVIGVRCEKQKDCYVCTVKTQWFIENHIFTSEKDYPYCDVTEDWVNDFEKINTYSDTLTNMVQTCKCK